MWHRNIKSGVKLLGNPLNAHFRSALNLQPWLGHEQTRPVWHLHWLYGRLSARWKYFRRRGQNRQKVLLAQMFLFWSAARCRQPKRRCASPVYILRTLLPYSHDLGKSRPGRFGITFGCTNERVSTFLQSECWGCQVDWHPFSIYFYSL